MGMNARIKKLMKSTVSLSMNGLLSEAEQCNVNVNVNLSSHGDLLGGFLNIYLEYSKQSRFVSSLVPLRYMLMH